MIVCFLYFPESAFIDIITFFFIVSAIYVLTILFIEALFNTLSGVLLFVVLDKV
jgi:hypothetical protein